MSIKTVAIIISESTYPFVVATLPEYAEDGPRSIIGMVLVLNDIVVIRPRIAAEGFLNYTGYAPAPRQTIVTIRNNLLTKKEFKANYDVVNTTDDPPKLSKMFFYEVERKKFKE